MAGTTIPGETVGTPYSGGPDNPALESYYSTLLASPAVGTATAVIVDDISGFSVGDTLSIYLDSGVIFTSVITFLDSGTSSVTFTDALPGSGAISAAGNGVWGRITRSASNFNTATLETDQVIGFPDNYLICDQTGFKIPVREGLRKQWNGLYVRQASFETRHPLEFERSKPESDQKGSPRPEPDDDFLATNQVSATDL